MAMKVITLLNEKGGCGKTTVATYLAAGLALRDQRVLLLDTDAQGNATSVFDIPKSPAFHDLLVRGAKWSDDNILVQVNPDIFGKPTNLFVVPSNFETTSVPMHLRDVTMLRARLQEVADAFDYVIIDTQPNPTLMHSAIVLATDYIIYPTQCEPFSAWEGLPDSRLHIDSIRQQAAQVGVHVAEVAGIIPTMYRAKTALHQHFVESLISKHDDLVWEPIPLRTAIPESQLLKEFTYTAAPDLDITAVMWRIVDRVQALGVQVG